MKRMTFAVTLALIATTAAGQQELKNVQVLKGLTPGQLFRAMQFISASLGVTCDFCHVRAANGELDLPNDAKDEKKTARQMMQLVIDTNVKYFKGQTEVSCETCHRGAPNPVSVPVLPIALVPRPAEAQAAPKPPLPTRDEVVARYAKALGNLNEKALATMELKGVREAQQGKTPIDVVIAPGRMRATGMTPQGEMVNVIDGSSGWVRDAKGTRAMEPNQIETATMIANAYRPTLPNDIPANARVHLLTKVGDRDAYLMVARFGENGRERLYFDAETGLLVRRIRLTPTPIGLIPQQTDFSDYREVDGMKLPFVVKVVTVDPRAGATRTYSEIRLNAKTTRRSSRNRSELSVVGYRSSAPITDNPSPTRRRAGTRPSASPDTARPCSR
ncbi:MAG TPA: c-type cytochrome [Thermoanaerobaculia bacterium]